MEHQMGFAPTTICLEGRDSTIELLMHLKIMKLNEVLFIFVMCHLTLNQLVHCPTPSIAIILLTMVSNNYYFCFNKMDLNPIWLINSKCARKRFLHIGATICFVCSIFWSRHRVQRNMRTKLVDYYFTKGRPCLLTEVIVIRIEI